MGSLYIYSHSDPGNCREYYKGARGRLFCIQGMRGNFGFYPCTSDGEPIHEIPMPPKSAFDTYKTPA